MVDPTSVLAHYRRLIALRHQEPVVALGDSRLLLQDDEQVARAASELVVGSYPSVPLERSITLRP